MRKFMILLAALLMTLGLAACSSKGNSEANAEKTPSPEKTEVKKEMVKFYLELGNIVNAKNVDLKSYEADVAKAAEDPTVKLKPEEKIKASKSATAVVDELKKVQVPAVLKAQNSDLETALKDYKASYQMKADELKKDSPSLDKANAIFNQGDEMLGKAQESVKLLPASLEKQVN